MNGRWGGRPTEHAGLRDSGVVEVKQIVALDDAPDPKSLIGKTVSFLMPGWRGASGSKRVYGKVVRLRGDGNLSVSVQGKPVWVSPSSVQVSNFNTDDDMDEDCMMDESGFATDPPVSEAERKAMGAAMNGKSKLGIPKSVGKEFIDADPGGKLPARKK